MCGKHPIGMIALAGFLLLALVQPAAAAPPAAPLMGTTITVTSAGDDISANGNCTLREAIQAANTDRKVDRCPAGSGTDTIKLGARTYQMKRAGRVEDSNRTGDFDIRTSMVIVGAGMGKTIIELNGIDRAFDGRSTAITVTIQDMTIRNGFTGDGVLPDHGGALVNRGKMTLRRVEFTGNQTTGNVNEMGGAVWNKNTLTVTGSLFTGNHSDRYGGAIANSLKITVDSTTFDGNSSTDGGAIYNGRGATMALNTNSKFYRNSTPGSYSGSAVHNDGAMTAKYNRYEGNNNSGAAVIYSTGSAVIRYSTFKNNDTGIGGVIWCAGEGTMTVSHSYLYGNVSITGDDGQIHSYCKSVVVDKVTVQGGFGPGVVAETGTLRVVNSTFSNLTGGNWTCAGVVCAMNNATFSLESVTVSGSRVREDGGAVDVVYGHGSMHNTIVTNTRTLDGTAYMPDCVGDTLQSKGYNLISRADGCMAMKTTGDKFGTMATPRSAGLNALAMNGGRTPTYALTSTSAARNAGDPALTVKTDQRGYVRPAGTRPDIGAYEYGAAAP